MKGRALILGSGVMARAIGTLLIGHGWDIRWVSGNPLRALPLLQKEGAKAVRRARMSGVAEPGSYSAGGYDDLPPDAFDIIIESTVESLAIKRMALSRVKKFIGNATILLSNSSSILPQNIDPVCIGMHFFQPIELTGMVEVIESPLVRPDTIDRVCQYARAWELSVIRQSGKATFAANRLLVPLQAAAMRLLMTGVPATVVDAVSQSEAIAQGMLSLMDRVGLETIRAAVANYQFFMDNDENDDAVLLLKGLDRLIGMGKRGLKNNDGFLEGAPLPWPPARSDTIDQALLNKEFRRIFVGTCTRFVDKEYISAGDLDLVLERIFDSRIFFEQLRRDSGTSGGDS